MNEQSDLKEQMNDVATLMASANLTGAAIDGFPLTRILSYCRQSDDLRTFELVGLDAEAADMLSKFVESWRTVGLAKVILPRSEPGQEADSSAECADESAAARQDPDRCSIVVYFDRPEDFEPPKTVVLDRVRSGAWVGVLKDLANA